MDLEVWSTGARLVAGALEPVAVEVAMGEAWCAGRQEGKLLPLLHRPPHPLVPDAAAADAPQRLGSLETHWPGGCVHQDPMDADLFQDLGGAGLSWDEGDTGWERAVSDGADGTPGEGRGGGLPCSPACSDSRLLALENHQWDMHLRFQDCLVQQGPFYE